MVKVKNLRDKNIYSVIKNERLKKEITLREFAKRINKSPGYYSLLEQGKIEKPAEETMLLILKELGIELVEESEKLEETYTAIQEKETKENTMRDIINELNGMNAKELEAIYHLLVFERPLLFKLHSLANTNESKQWLLSAKDYIDFLVEKNTK